MQNTGTDWFPVTGLRDVDALAESDDQRVEEVLVLGLMIVGAEERLERLGRLLGLVERDACEQMMDDMVVDDLVEEVPPNEADCAVNRRQRAASECPGFACVVRDGWMGVLQIRNSDWTGR